MCGIYQSEASSAYIDALVHLRNIGYVLAVGKKIADLHILASDASLKLTSDNVLEDESDEDEEEEEEDGKEMSMEHKILFMKVLGSAQRLRELDINMQAYLEPGEETTTKELLFASHLSGIRKLRSLHIRIADNHLVEVLQRCSGTLTCLELEAIGLMAVDQTSTAVLRQTLKMPSLSELSLEDLYNAEGDILDLGGTSHGEDTDYELTFEGPANIASRVHELLAGPLVFG